jgi:hypothetical protein
MHVNYAIYDCEMRRDAICVLYAYAYAMGDCSDRRGWMDPWKRTKPTSDLDAFICPPSRAVVEGPPNRHEYSNQDCQAS